MKSASEKKIIQAIKSRPSLNLTTETINAQPSRKRKINESEKSASAAKYVDNKLSRKIITLAQSLGESKSDDRPPTKRPAKTGTAAAATKLLPTGRHGRDEDAEGDDDEWEDADDSAAEGSDSDAASADADAADDLARQLYSEDAGGHLGQVDADQLRALIAEKRTELDGELLTDGGSDAGASRVSCLPDSVREHFESCRAVLRQYRSGKLPKPVKQLPHFAQWQELVELLEPNSWTAAAMCAVTKYFAAKGKSAALQFFQGYLLPRCRDDIAEYRRLNFHLYSALGKALFRQREFFCGLLLPWAKDAISLPEATILGGLLRRASIPVKYAAPALHMLLQLPYSGGRAILVRVLLEKKYNLPDPVLGQALAHFVAMETESADHLNEDGRLPVLWHQALLALVDRYGAYLSPEERQRVLRLCRQHQHPEITPAIRQALGQLQQRDAQMERD